MKGCISIKIIFLSALLIANVHPLFGYSVLTHEAVVDATWDSTIKPLLLEKYPGATADELKEAHAYVYGGCVAPDMGYYPFGSKLFTNLVHYVRTGDFVDALLQESQNLNEYAFALGVLCHYNADKYGHPIGVNRCVPLVYPTDKEKYGSSVTYEQDRISHVRMEFGFDVLQTARGNYASPAYHDFIGFKVSKPVLDRAFLKTYGLSIDDIFKNFTLSVETFRWVVKNFFPAITRTAWASRKAQIKKTNPTITRRKFEYRMKRANYYHEFGKKHEHPGFFPSVLAVVIRVLPKVGPLRDLKIKIPGPEGEKLFIQSFDTVVARYTASVGKLKRHNNYSFSDINYDTGEETWPGEYGLADSNYVVLLLKLDQTNFKNVDAGLKQNILKYYGQCNEKMAAMTGTGGWTAVTGALNKLRVYQASK